MQLDLGNLVAAIGSLGIAAYALVDVSKIGRRGGVSNSGFAFIEAVVRRFFPNATRGSAAGAGVEGQLLGVLHGNWINGAALGDQKAIAKSLIKLGLSPKTAPEFAKATGVDAQVLANVATGMTKGDELAKDQMNVLGRFDLVLTAMLDEGYQRADQRYRNSAKAWASVVAVVLAVLGGWSVVGKEEAYFFEPFMWQAVLCGVLATPLAPISKDLASALTAGVKVAQSLRK